MKIDIISEIKKKGLNDRKMCIKEMCYVSKIGTSF